MANLRETRRRLRIVMSVLIAINVIAACAFVFFIVDGMRSPAGQSRELHQKVQQQMRVAVPTEVVQQRVKEAREQINTFYDDRFAGETSQIFEELGKLAKENGVSLNQAHYRIDETGGIEGVRMMMIDANLNGDYQKTMKFINAMERDKLFFIVDNVSLGDQNGGAVRLNIRVETYLRGEG